MTQNNMLEKKEGAELKKMNKNGELAFFFHHQYVSMLRELDDVARGKIDAAIYSSAGRLSLVPGRVQFLQVFI